MCICTCLCMCTCTCTYTDIYFVNYIVVYHAFVYHIYVYADVFGTRVITHTYMYHTYLPLYIYIHTHGTLTSCPCFSEEWRLPTDAWFGFKCDLLVAPGGHYQWPYMIHDRGGIIKVCIRHSLSLRCWIVSVFCHLDVALFAACHWLIAARAA